MKIIKKAGTFVLILFIIACLFPRISAFAYADDAHTQTQTLSASQQVSQDENAPGNKKSNVVSIIAWAVVGAGVIFILVVLISSLKRKKGINPSGIKYRRSPYMKKKKRFLENEYFNYKKSKYK